MGQLSVEKKYGETVQESVFLCDYSSGLIVTEERADVTSLTLHAIFVGLHTHTCTHTYEGAESSRDRKREREHRQASRQPANDLSAVVLDVKLPTHRLPLEHGQAQIESQRVNGIVEHRPHVDTIEDNR